VLLERFSVFVYTVQIANIDIDKTKAIQYLKDENCTFFSNLSIVQTAFLKSVFTNTKTYSSLIVELDSFEQANRLICTGLCKGGKVKRCKLFELGCKLTQCFNCQRYRHVAKACKSLARCSHCGAVTAMDRMKLELVIVQLKKKKSTAFRVSMLKNLNFIKPLQKLFSLSPIL
jgi:hypothetical protein